MLETKKNKAKELSGKSEKSRDTMSQQ